MKLSSSITHILFLSTFTLLIIIHTSSAQIQPAKDTTSPLINQTCAATFDPPFCVQALESNPNAKSANVKNLTLISIDLSSKNASDTYEVLSRSLNDASIDPQTKQVYKSCYDKYRVTLSSLKAAMSYLKSGDEKKLAEETFNALSPAQNCADEFEVPVKDPLNIRKHANDLDQLCYIIFVLVSGSQ